MLASELRAHCAMQTTCGRFHTFLFESMLRCSLGNKILHAALTCFVDALACGMPSLIEHPEKPVIAARPSIFKSSVVKRLMEHPNVDSHSFKQGFLGQISPKPTRLLSAHAPWTSQYINEFSTQTRKTALIDVYDPDGAFATAKLKTYPPRMNAALLATFVHACLLNFLGDTVDHSQYMQKVVTALHLRCLDLDDLGPDAYLLEEIEPDLSDTHPLACFVDWPDKDAKIGPDYAFALAKL